MRLAIESGMLEKKIFKEHWLKNKLKLIRKDIIMKRTIKRKNLLPFLPIPDRWYPQILEEYKQSRLKEKIEKKKRARK